MPDKPNVAKEKELEHAFVSVAESMARAAWTFVRQGASLHATIFNRMRDMADGALAKLKEPKD